MSHLSTTLRIEAPAAAVFDLIADPARSPEWQSLLVEMGDIAGRPGGIGSSFVGYYRAAGRNPPPRFVGPPPERPALLQVNGATTGGWARWTTVIEPLGDNVSEIRVDLEYELPGEIVGSLFGLLTGNRIEREFRRTYDSLRRLAERGDVEASMAPSPVEAASPAAAAADVRSFQPLEGSVDETGRLATG